MPGLLRFPVLLCVLAAAPVYASDFSRPIPQPQSSTTELWFALASLFLCVALFAVHWLVKRR